MRVGSSDGSWRNTPDMHFVFSDGDPGGELLHEQGGRAVRRLIRSGAITVDRLPQADHTLTGHSARERAIQLLSRRMRIRA